MNIGKRVVTLYTNEHRKKGRDFEYSKHTSDKIIKWIRVS